MTHSEEPETHDLVGIGCGPSNLALAVALDELKSKPPGFNAAFLEKQQDYHWHGNTITSQSDLQICFLKDLVTLRDPTSPYSFLNYLHQHHRLDDFINLSTFYPSRLEFNDYLRWVASHFADQVQYGEEVVSVEPVACRGEVSRLRVISRTEQGQERIRQARSLVFSAGGKPNIPKVFRPHKNDRRIFHHSQYLSAMASLKPTQSGPLRVAVIGGGQSAAEAFLDVCETYRGSEVDLILRKFSLKPADSSPFVNEIFTPNATDMVFDLDQSSRDSFLQEHWHANYSAVDMDLIKKIYAIFYQQKVSGSARHSFRHSSVVERVDSNPEWVELLVRNTATQEVKRSQYDIVILATGYHRNEHRQLLSPISDYLGDFRVDRHYRIVADDRLKVPVFLQGYCERSPRHQRYLIVCAGRSGR